MPEAAREVGRERETGDETPAPPAALPRVAPSASEGDGQVLFGRYAVVRLVAVTPTARVYQAVDRVSSRVVAVKLFSAAAVRDAGRDALRRFEREALALGRLRHPSIVALVDYVADGPALVLEWMDGGSLANVLAAGPIAPARAAEIARALLAALAEAHRRGILHRDVKPSNVLFDAAGAARLSDFGVAHVGERAATVTAGILGTLAYMAPEQRAGAAATTQTDVYGVGALLWHCLTGGPPAARLPPLADDLPPETYAAAADLIAVAAERPADALSARALLARVPWPAEVPTRRPRSLPPPASRPETTARLEPRGDGVFFDELLGRLVQIAAARPERVARARAFARADHPALAAVLALDEAADRVIVEVIEGDAAEPPFTPAELAELAGALGALHRAGGAHGRIDRKHLVRRGGRLVLRFPMDAGAAAEADDLRALDELRRRSSAP
jgi:serine/threonine-protein kinase